jgi:hypothetical protein
MGCVVLQKVEAGVIGAWKRAEKSFLQLACALGVASTSFSW